MRVMQTLFSGLLYCFFMIVFPLAGAPIITSLSTNHVPAGENGREITIYGSGFSSLTKVQFGPIVATVKSHNDTQIDVIVPKNVVSTVHITVTASGKKSKISAPSYFAYTGNWTAYFTCTLTGQIFGIDTATNQTTYISPLSFITFPGPFAITPDGSTAYICSGVPGGAVACLKLVNNSLSFIQGIMSAPPKTMAVAPDGFTAYGGFGKSVFPIAVPSNVLQTPIKFSSSNLMDMAVTVDAAVAYLAQDKLATPVVLSSDSIMGSISLPGDANAVATHPDGRIMYFALENRILSCVAVGSGTLLSDINIGIVPDALSLAINPNGKEAYVLGADGQTKYFVIVDLEKGRVVNRLQVPAQAHAIAVTPDGKKAYTSLSDRARVVQVNLETRTTLELHIPNISNNDYVVVTPDPAPIALFTVIPGAPGSTTIFDASGSISPVGTITNYSWDFGDASPAGSGVNPSHTYATAGIYTVTLTVTNSAGTSTSWVFTGKTMNRKGGPSARAEKILTIGSPPPPTVTSVLPQKGPESGETKVVIQGTNFSHDSLSVNIGSPATNVQLISSTMITATTASGTGSKQVVVTTGSGSSTEPIMFTYGAVSLGQPVVTSLTPNKGPAEGGQRLEIRGSGFIDVLCVFFDLAAVLDVTVDSPELLIVNSPKYHPSFPETVQVQVMNGNGNESDPSPNSEYTYEFAPPSQPEVSAISPAQGPQAGGSRITIRGEYFLGTTGVYFNNTPATNFFVNSATEIVAIVPAGTGPVDVTVTTEGGGDSDPSPASSFIYLATPPAAPTVSTIVPNNGLFSGNTRVKITGSNFSVEGEIEVYFGNVSALDVEVLSDRMIEAISPPGTGDVFVRVTTRGGSSNGVTFSYDRALPPRVTGVLPNAGPAGEQERSQVITVTGLHFYEVDDVLFERLGLPPIDARYEVISQENLTVFVPQGVAGGVNIIVRTNHGSSFISQDNAYNYLANPPQAPTIDTISPMSGTSAGKTLVTITGENFGEDGGVWVYFEDVPALSVRVISDNTIEVDSPPGVGTADVVVTTIGGTSNSAIFTYISPGQPTVVKLEPNSGPEVGDQHVAITGTNFIDVRQVYFGERLALEFAVESPTEIIAVTPAGTGVVHVTVVTQSGTSDTSEDDKYTYLPVPPPAPRVDTISPTRGTIDGGTSVIIIGENFNVGDIVVVYFGEHLAIRATVLSGTQIVAISPPFNTALGNANAGREVPVIVSTIGGDSNKNVLFTYTFPSPIVTRVSPDQGPEEGNSEVVITGNHFRNVTAVYFGQAASEDFEVDSDENITVLTPPGVGTVDVRVETEFGISPISQNAKYTYLEKPQPQPKVTSVKPNIGPAAGGTRVIVEGENFVPGETVVLFGKVPATDVQVLSESRLRATSPQGFGTVHVQVTTPGGTSGISAADEFTYILPQAPTVTEVSPNEGPQTGGSTVTITGTNFNAVVLVAFGPYLATNVVRISDTVITADTPPGEGTVQVIVTTEGGSSSPSDQSEFTYLSGPVLVPTVTNVLPNFGPASGGTRVTVTGTHFVSGDTDVYFGDIPGENVVVFSPRMLKVTTPASNAGVVNVTVTTPGGTSAISSKDKFTFIQEQILFPPTKAKGIQIENRFATQTDIINRVTWQAPTKGIAPVAYKIYKDAALKKLLGVVSAKSKKPYHFTQHNRKESKVYTYYIVSVDEKGNQSKPAVVTIR